MSKSVKDTLRRVSEAFAHLANERGASRSEADKLGKAFFETMTRLEPEFTPAQRIELQELQKVAHPNATSEAIEPVALALFAPAALLDWVVQQRPGFAFTLEDARRWLVIARAPPNLLTTVDWEVLYVASHLANKTQVKKFEATFDQLWQKENAMAVTYIFDPRGLPAGFTPALQTLFVEAVFKRLDTSFYQGGTGSAATDLHVSAVIVGSVLLKEIFDPLSASFAPAVDEAALASLKDTPAKPPGGKKNRDLYIRVSELIAGLPGRTVGNATNIAYQEIAYVSRFGVENAHLVAFDSDYFPNQVRLGVDKYVEGTPPELTLSIPPLNGAGGTDSGFNPDGTKAVGSISQAYQLDVKANVIRTVDRITELYMQGLLPMNYDNAAKAIEDYYWSSEDRLHEGARNSIYGRVLGIPNTEVSKEVVPNRDRDALLQRFVAALAEHDRQQTISDLLQPGAARAMSLTVEQVRKAGRDVLANASLYGWGGTQSLARRLVQHLSTAMNILKQPSLQAVFGVTSPYQVIERVSRTEFGSVPNLLMAINVGEAEKGLHDLLAKYLTAFLEVNSAQPLFDFGVINDGGTDARPRIAGAIPITDERQLKTHAQAWLASRSYGDAQVEKYSQPQDSPYTGSMPTFGGGGGAAGGDVMDKLRQMVSSGSAPSLDQLQQLLPAMR